MNIYKKYCPNVFVAQCDREYQYGDVIEVETKYGRTNEHIVHNLVHQKDGMFFYSITRADGIDNQVRAIAKVDRLNKWADNAEKRSDDWCEKSNEGREFLRLAEPIKVGHHSEKRHRALIERNWHRMERSVQEADKAEAYRARTAYWESMANKVDLSMPESLSFFSEQLKDAKEYHAALKDGSIPKDHSFSLTYAKKRVNELEDKCKIAQILWG